MNFVIELRQLNKPQQNKTLTQTVFFINTSIHYEVHYLPNNLYMNLKSYSPEPLSFSAADDAGGNNFRRSISTLLSRTLIQASNFSPIVDSVFKKVNSIASEIPNSGCNFIPLSLSIRAIKIQNYNVEDELAWARMIPSDSTVISSNLPAMEKSVRELETVVYGGDNGRSISECPLCLKEFKEGEEIKRMPCFHVYHGDCIVKWLEKSHLCPCCRFPMPVCRVVEGAFPFYRRNHCGRTAVGGGGGKLRTTPRMSVRYQVY